MNAARAEELSLFEKLWAAHSVAQLDEASALIAIDRVLLHERTGAIALRELDRKGRSVADPGRVFCTMDHIVDTRPGRSDVTKVPGGLQLIRETRERAKAAGIRLFDIGDPSQGIVHVMSPELGIVLPGATLVCPDSHTCTQGAMGALAWGIGTTEAEHAMATGTLRVRKPRSMRITLSGDVAPCVTPKDLALALLARHGAAGGNGHVVEYAGQAVLRMDMEGRFTLCNMATEFSAVTGLIAPDKTTFAYLSGRRFAPTGSRWMQAVEQWRELTSGTHARFDREIFVDVSDAQPMVTWGTSPQHAVPVTGVVPTFHLSGITREAYDRALKYMDVRPGGRLTDLSIDAAFIGSCTNSRISDLRRAASVLRGRRVAAHVRAICVPGSTAVKRQAESEGLNLVFESAGFEWRESGCSMCFFAGGDSFGLRERVISSTNRNFESRQGPESRTHIASPEVVAASAVAGHIADIREYVP